MSEAKSRYREQSAEFIGELVKLDAAGLARLRRNGGRALDEARDVYRVFFPLLPANLFQAPQVFDDFFLIATLFPLDRIYRELPIGERPRESLGATLRRVREAQRIECDEDANAYNSLDRRFEALLDADRGESLRFRLGQIVRLIAARRLPIDWPRLLDDVRAWDGDRQQRRFIQPGWAKDYFAG